MGLPVGGATITQYYGPTDEKLDGAAFGYAHFNRGVDFAAKEGTPVQNVAPGTVIWVGDAGDGWGYSVKVMLDDGRIVSYGHLQDQSSSLQIGQKVTPGTFIGKVGNTGKSTGPHLSFDVYDKNGTPLDPSDLLGINVAIDNRTGTSWQPRTGGSGGGGGTTEWLSNLDNDSVSKIREGLRQRALSAWEAYAETGSDADYKTYITAISDLMDFEEVFGSSSDGTSAAQRAFENALKLQDLESVLAERQFNRWLNKQQLADAAATGEATQRAQHNANLAAMQEAINTSQTPGLLPRPTDAGYIETGYQDLLKKWQEKFGVGDEPPASVGTGVTLPGTQATAPTEPLVTGGPNARDNAVSNLKLAGDFPVKQPEEYPGAWGTVPFGKVIYNILSGAEGKKVPGNRQWDENLQYGIGKVLGWSGKQLMDKGGDAYQGTKKQAKKWWNLATNPQKWWNGIPRHAEGTMSHPGGPALVNEKGPEMVVMPDGQLQQLQGGPTVMNLPPGTAVLPAGIDPREAFYFAQVRGAMAQPAKGQAGANDPAAQMARAQDPQLLEKVRESILRAAAGMDAVNPPYTPVLGPGIEKDYWKDWRGLTGVPAHAPLPGQQAPGKGVRR
ncbi:MAG: hypothetical protein KatS3mg064_0603 [Tepidiforma sp.]|nr:M23 family metallopeptidase [Tepidiforma sp.]GIW17446.1 MAG: hypothetical protein KatS3mg064_0603 [Tepidiforma sp.]